MRRMIALWVMMTVLAAATPLSMVTLEGNKIGMQNIEGNFLFQNDAYRKGNLILFFFGTRCPYCAKEMPQIEKMYQNGEITVIGVEAQAAGSDGEIRRFVRSEGITFPVLNRASGKRLVDYLIARRLWIGGVPYYIWVDRYGNLEPLDFRELARFRSAAHPSPRE